MDLLTTIRSVFTVLMFVSFVGIVLWAWSARSRRRFDEAAALPFADEERARASSAAPRR
ncbi:cytochrome c oxidase cbb3-type subunit 4 [Plasticicumulans lactativorans]|uniref:Cytochrome c oxidase cbb3-type subunit 4 n=1 Tax=Plasticicumulans lactativorans TaxID=1133106 RepID=A0A4R2LEE1_9GAMM|nr:cbb3-type cytochrome c oxidase subunit 3 [Plasticicumulans lactativorans]TCO81241.1 cytochrome c oxidase cbb3-type subunit 4 [Plasticicumulans lactativorans]